MNIHFIHTGGEFTYRYFLSVISAWKTQKGKIFLWTNQDNEIISSLKDKVTIRSLELPEFRAFKDKPEYFKLAHLKDYLTYKILFQEGGLCLDLDTICIKDATDLLGTKEMMVMSDCRAPYRWRYIRSLAICAGRKGSLILAEAIRRCEEILQGEYMAWADSSTVLISELAEEYPHDFALPPIDTLGGYEGNDLLQMYTNTKLHPDLRIMHLLAFASNSLYTDINPDYITNSDSLVAKTVREVLGWKCFVEIGSNCFDTLNYLSDEGWHGLIVEPVKEYLDKLERKVNVNYENVAIGLEMGGMDFKYISEDTIKEFGLPEWAKGLGSFEDHPIVEERGWFQYITTIEVPVVTMKGLLDRYNIKRIDFLKIDTEGYDCKILLNMDLSKVDKILFEYKHCPPSEIFEVLDRLRGYSIEYKGDNILAIKNDL